MLYDLLIAAILIVAFFMCIGAYCLGFKHGKTVRNDVAPVINLNPIQAITEFKEHKEEKKKAKEESKIEDTFIEGFNNIMSYDGNPQE